MDIERNRARMRNLLADPRTAEHFDLRVFSVGEHWRTPQVEILPGEDRLRPDCGTVCCVAGWAYALDKSSGGLIGPAIDLALAWLGLAGGWTEIFLAGWEDCSPVTVSARLDMAYEGKTVAEIRKELP